MFEKIYFSSKVEKSKNSDLYLNQCGTEACAPNHDWGPGIRDCYLIHYVLSGEGIFQTNNDTWHIKKGNGFLIFPNDVSYYKADNNNPWNYCWVGFNGIKAPSCLKQAGLSKDTPIFTYDKDDELSNCIFELLRANRIIKGRDLKTTSLLYEFMHLLVYNADSPLPESETEQIHEKYVRSAIEYIQMNYSREMSVSSLSNYIGLDRSYFYTLFKKFTDMSPQQFLLMLRMEKACELLANSSLPIGHVACSVGYHDQLLFSKMFKKVKGISPSGYRLLLCNSGKA